MRDDSGVRSLPLNLGLADGQGEVLLHDLIIHLEGCSVEKLVLEEDDGVGVANGCLEESLAVLGVVRADDLESGAVTVPGGVALGVLSGDASGATVGASVNKEKVKVGSRTNLHFDSYLNTMGTLTFPPDMANVLAAELIT